MTNMDVDESRGQGSTSTNDTTISPIIVSNDSNEVLYNQALRPINSAELMGRDIHNFYSSEVVS